MKLLNENSTLYKTIAFTILILTGIGTIVFLYDRFIGSKSSFQKADSFQRLVISKNPEFHLKLKIKLPDLPDILMTVDTTKNNDTVNSSKEESIIFSLQGKPKKKFVETQPLGKIDTDSIFKKTNSSRVEDILAILNITYAIKNYSKDRSYEILFFSLADTPSFIPIIRDFLLNTKLDTSNMAYSYIPKSESKLIMPDSIYNYSKDIIPLFFDESNNFIVHFYIIYKDGNGNFYDSYYWAKFHFTPKEFGVYPQPIYRLQTDGSYILDEIVFHYNPKKPNTNEVFQLLNTLAVYEKSFSEDEVIQIKKFFDKYRINYKD